MIEVKNLSKFFGDVVAVDNISFTVEKGEVLGFLGPNAAGKSTTMRMITGFLPPSSGTALVGGHDILKDSLKARAMIGYLPENAPVYGEMTVSSFLDFCAEIRGFSGKQKAKRKEEIIEKCFLKDVKHQPIDTLSKGYKQRVCFAQSIIHDPQYLIMDEPTDGLDPNQKHEVRTMIKEMSKDKTIIISTHILEEVEAVCTRAIIIAKGKIVADDTPQALKGKSPLHGTYRATISLGSHGGEDALQALRDKAEIKNVEVLARRDTQIDLRIYPAGILSANDILTIITEANIKLEAFSMEEGRLDRVFRMITT